MRSGGAERRSSGRPESLQCQIKERPDQWKMGLEGPRLMTPTHQCKSDTASVHRTTRGLDLRPLAHAACSQDLLSASQRKCKWAPAPGTTGARKERKPAADARSRALMGEPDSARDKRPEATAIP